MHVIAVFATSCTTKATVAVAVTVITTTPVSTHVVWLASWPTNVMVWMIVISTSMELVAHVSGPMTPTPTTLHVIIKALRVVGTLSIEALIMIVIIVASSSRTILSASCSMRAVNLVTKVTQLSLLLFECFTLFVELASQVVQRSLLVIIEHTVADRSFGLLTRDLMLQNLGHCDVELIAIVDCAWLDLR